MNQITDGINRLATDATAAIMGITVVVVALLLAYFYLRRTHADDHEMVKWDNRIRTALISGALVFCASGIATWVLGYFKK